jgi:hypothetical protein
MPSTFRTEATSKTAARLSAAERCQQKPGTPTSAELSGIVAATVGNPATADMLASERMFAKVWTTPTAKYVRLL